MPLDRGEGSEREEQFTIYKHQGQRKALSREEKPIVGKARKSSLWETPLLDLAGSRAAGKSGLQNQTGAGDPFLLDFKP